MYRQTGVLLDTVEGSKWIFVLSTSRALYVGQKKKGVFQHSSFMSGGATTAAGRLVAHDGVLEVHTFTVFISVLKLKSFSWPIHERRCLYIYTVFRLYGHTVDTIFQQMTISRNLLASSRTTMWI